jgi:hypothetical protein
MWVVSTTGEGVKMGTATGVGIGIWVPVAQVLLVLACFTGGGEYVLPTPAKTPGRTSLPTTPMLLSLLSVG